MKSFLTCIIFSVITILLAAKTHTMPLADTVGAPPPPAMPGATPATPPPTMPSTMPSTPPPPAMPGVMPGTPPPALPATIPGAPSASTLGQPVPTAGAAMQAGAQQEINQLNKIIEDIQNAKKALKDQIKQLDDKINEARTEVASMRKKSSEILSKAQESEAQALLNTINTGLGKITATQTQLSGDFSKTFNDTATKIQNLIQQGQDVVKSLIAKGYQYQITQAQMQTLEEKTKTTAAQEAQKKAAAIAAQKKTDGIWGSITQFFAKAISRIKKIFTRAQDIVTSDKQASPKEVVKKKIVEPAPQPTTGVIPTVSSNTKTLITTQLAAADTTIKQIETQQKTIEQKLQSLDQSTTSFIDALKNIQTKPVAARTRQEETTEPKWKRLSMLVFSELLDATAYVLGGIKYVFMSIYHYFFAPTVQRLVSDEKEKIKEEEKSIKKTQTKEAKSAPKPTSPPAPSTPPNQLAPATTPNVTPPPVPASTGMPGATPPPPPSTPTSGMPGAMPSPSAMPEAGGMMGMPMM